jgi:hypothetical protein
MSTVSWSAYVLEGMRRKQRGTIGATVEFVFSG